MKFKGAADSFMESFNRKVAERKAEQERQRALMETRNLAISMGVSPDVAQYVSPESYGPTMDTLEQRNRDESLRRERIDIAERAEMKTLAAEAKTREEEKAAMRARAGALDIVLDDETIENLDIGEFDRLMSSLETRKTKDEERQRQEAQALIGEERAQKSLAGQINIAKQVAAMYGFDISGVAEEEIPGLVQIYLGEQSPTSPEMPAVIPPEIQQLEQIAMNMMRQAVQVLTGKEAALEAVMVDPEFQQISDILAEYDHTSRARLYNEYTRLKTGGRQIERQYLQGLQSDIPTPQPYTPSNTPPIRLPGRGF